MEKTTLKPMRIKRITIAPNSDTYDIKMRKNHNFFASGILVHNCSEQALDQDGDCDLGSINLAKYVCNPFTDTAYFDYFAFARDVQLAIEALDNVLTIELNDGRYISDTQMTSLACLRRVGLGVMGYADALAMMGLRYKADPETLEFTDAIFTNMRDAAYMKSIQLAARKGSCIAVRDMSREQRKVMVEQGFFATLPENIRTLIVNFGIRNIALLSVAPTGSISNLLGATSGIEPLFAAEYTRRVRMSGEDKFITYVHPGVKMSREMGLPDSIWDTAYEVSPRDHVLIQAAIQKYVDSAISKTINMPASATVEEIEDVYMLAWEHGLKGCTVYRDASRSTQVLYQKGDVPKELQQDAAKESEEEKCPNCGESLVHHGGCSECLSCGFAKCSL